MPMPTGPATLAILHAMQSIIISEALVSAASPFAALSTADQTRYGVSKAVFVGRPKDFKDAYLPQCCLWVPEGDAGVQTVGLVGYSGRVMDLLEVTVQAFVDMRTDWYVAEQKILQIRDALWPAVVHHVKLGGSVATVIDASVREGRGLCYEEIASVEYRCYELIWQVRQQYNVSGGLVS